MIRVTVLGAGRIGKLHARNLVGHSGAKWERLALKRFTLRREFIPKDRERFCNVSRTTKLLPENQCLGCQQSGAGL
jgi:hypothetical protein